MASSEWQRVRLLPDRKFSAHQEMRPPDFRQTSSALKNSVINYWLKPMA
ncbi:MAG: hypothetical protein LM632_04010 [Armatimonadetes bacterium]|nr:hypothetical protein [Armatimonadota bacterium]